MRKDERGVALLTVTIVSVLLLLLGLSMTFTSMTGFTMSYELANKKRARMVAEAGVSALKDTFKGSSISTLLATTTAVPQYINYSEPTPGSDAATYFDRNPLAPLEAMNMDFENLPTQIGTRTVNGFLTPVGGVPFGTGGRYWAKTTDNDDGDSDLTADTDKTIYLRVLGIQRNSGGQIATYGGNVKNSIAMIETTFKRDRTFVFSGSLSLYGADVLPADGSKVFGGNSFLIDGYDHPTMTLKGLDDKEHSPHTTGEDSAGITAIDDGGGAATMVNTLITGMVTPQPDNVIGNTATLPSVEDITASIAADPEVDAANIFDPNYVMNFIENISSLADLTIPHDTNFSGNMGDDAAPQITYGEGDLHLSGGGKGAGLLIVKGRLDFSGGFTYRGLILVVGEGAFDAAGQSVNLLGGLFVAKIIDNGDGTYSYGIPTLGFSGASGFYYQKSAIDIALRLMPMKTLSWREITREMEPAF